MLPSHHPPRRHGTRDNWTTLTPSRALISFTPLIWQSGVGPMKRRASYRQYYPLSCTRLPSSHLSYRRGTPSSVGPSDRRLARLAPFGWSGPIHGRSRSPASTPARHPCPIRLHSAKASFGLHLRSNCLRPLGTYLLPRQPIAPLATWCLNLGYSRLDLSQSRFRYQRVARSWSSMSREAASHAHESDPTRSYHRRQRDQRGPNLDLRRTRTH